MPDYEYVCLDCGKEFTVTSAHEHERGHATCPRCQSKEVEQQPSTGEVVTSRKDGQGRRR